MKIIIRANVLKAHLQVVSKVKARPELQCVSFRHNQTWSGNGRVMLRTANTNVVHTSGSETINVKFDQVTIPAQAVSAVIDTDNGLVYFTKDYYSSLESLPPKLHVHAIRISKVSVVSLPYPDVSKLQHKRGSVSDVSVMSDDLDKINKVARALAGKSNSVDLSFQSAKDDTFLATIKHGFAVCDMFIRVNK